MLVTYITTTGHRLEAFKLCEKYMARQTYKGDVQWIVVDDGWKINPTKVTMGQEYVKGPKEWRHGINTQRYSLDAAIPLIKGDYVFIIEDDDVYKEQYVETYLDFLKYADIVGEVDAIYYSLKVKGYKEMKNYTHSSLCQTAFTKRYIPVFDRAVNSGEMFVDIKLWSMAIVNKHRTLNFHGPKLCIGMKGLPGRTGIGFGHTNTHEFVKDTQYLKIKELLGADADPYIKWMR